MVSVTSRVQEAAREWSEAACSASSWLVHTLNDLARSLPSPPSSLPFAPRWRRKPRRSGLPLPLPPSWPLPSTTRESDVTFMVTEILEEVANSLMGRLHDAHKNLQFWKARAEGSHMQKVRFMVLERGPLAFVQGIAKLVHDWVWECSSTQGLAVSAVSQISKRTVLLYALECCLALVVGEVYKVAERFGECALKGQREAVSVALLSLHKALLTLEGSYALNQSSYNGKNGGATGIVSDITLQFHDLPEGLSSKTEWTDAECASCIDLIRENMKRLEDSLDLLLQNYRKPRRATRHWLRYTGGAVGLALVSGWLIQHSPLMGSRDIENWLKQGGETILAFSKEHVEKPLMSIRDDLFETFRRRHHGAAELEDVQLTVDSLHRMLKAFTEQLKGREAAASTTEQEMMEIVMNRYEKEITHPLQNLLGGELFRAMLIQVQKLKLDIETAMLELNQILRANEINFAILAALPAFLFAMILVWLLRASLLQSKGTEGRGRASRLHRRMLFAEVERTIMTYQLLREQGKEDEMPWHYGMTIYLLDQFYISVDRHAVASGEWLSLRGDILDLAKSDASVRHKLAITARVERIYECIIPARPS